MHSTCFRITLIKFSQFKIGVGIGLNPIAIGHGDRMFLPVGLGNFYIPIQISNNIRIEPELGIMSFNDEISSEDQSNTNSTSILRYGVGGFYTINPAKSFKNYFGVRLGLMSATDEDESDPESEYDPNTEESQSAFYFGFSVGGEYFFSDYFSLGAELQINYISFGEPEYKPASEHSDYKDYSRTYLSNNGVIFARFYFN